MYDPGFHLQYHTTNNETKCILIPIDEGKDNQHLSHKHLDSKIFLSWVLFYLFLFIKFINLGRLRSPREASPTARLGQSHLEEDINQISDKRQLMSHQLWLLKE